MYGTPATNDCICNNKPVFSLLLLRFHKKGEYAIRETPYLVPTQNLSSFSLSYLSTVRSSNYREYTNSRKVTGNEKKLK